MTLRQASTGHRKEGIEEEEDKVWSRDCRSKTAKCEDRTCKVKSVIRKGVGTPKHNCLVLYFCYADDDMFRPLWAIFRSQKCI